jgi:hypothetical protein
MPTKPPVPPVPVRPVASHVQAALGRTAQARMPLGPPSHPLAPHRPAVAQPLGAQPRQPATAVQPHPQRPLAPHVQMATRASAAPAPRPNPPMALQPAMRPGVIQCTTVKASGRKTGASAETTVTGHSSSGEEVGRLLKQSDNPDARTFNDILAAVSRKKGGRSRGGSAYSCAEPHAVAQLLDQGFRLSQIRVALASEGRGLMNTCRYCSEWLDNGWIVDDVLREREQPSPEEQSTPAEQAPFRNLQDYPEEWPTLQQAYPQVYARVERS